MIIVIADDITGAAEIAGIAKSAGLETRLLMTGEGVKANDNPLVDHDIEAQVIVFATDTRQMVEADAVKEVDGLVNMIDALSKKLSSDVLLFKKTDSVLRGHIKAECDAILANTDYEQVLLVPQNPSKGRVVRNGLYYINNVLLNETQFANDPEFPAKTAAVSQLGVPDAENSDDMADIVKSAKPKTLFAGGADLFKAVLDNSMNTKYLTLSTKSDDLIHNLTTSQPYDLKSSKPQNLIMVCGSTQSKSVIETPLCCRYNAVECNMPENVFYGKDGAEAWLPSLKETFAANGIVLTINYPSQGGKDFAVRLRKVMAEIVKALADDCFELLSISPNSQAERTKEKAAAQPRLKLIIEGGATAFEILATLGWSTFDVVKEHFPGVVEIANKQTSIILKPGSYPWKGLLDE